MKDLKKGDFKKFTSWDELPINMSTDQAAATLGCDLPALRKRCKSGEIPNFRIGRVIKVPKEGLRDYIERITQLNSKSPAGQ